MTDQERPATGSGGFFGLRDGEPWMYHVLLAALFLLFVLVPIEDSLPLGNLMMRLITASIVLGGLVLVSDRPFLLAIGTVLALPSPLLRWLDLGQMGAVVVADLANVALMVFVTVVLLTRLLRHPVVTLATISGMTSVYLLMGIAWMVFYLLLETVQPCSFNGVPCMSQGNPLGDPRADALSSLFYFSFVTISTLGYGEITPATEVARTAAAMEAVVGQLFLVVILARMVGLMATPAPSNEEDG